MKTVHYSIIYSSIFGHKNKPLAFQNQPVLFYRPFTSFTMF